MQDFDVFCSKGVFFLSVPLGISRQGISSSVSFALMIIDSEVVTREFLGPTDLSGAQTLCVHKSSEVVMVGKHEDFISRALQVVLPRLESLNNG